MPEIKPSYTAAGRVVLVELTPEQVAAQLVEYANVRERLPIPQNRCQEQIVARLLETLDRDQNALVAQFVDLGECV